VDSQGTTAFSETETKDAQTTTTTSDLPLPVEPDVIYSSSELLKRLLSV